MNNIYQAPEADLSANPPPGQDDAMARALSGQFEFSVSAMLSEAWRTVHGNKGTVWVGIVLYLVVALPIYGVLDYFLDEGMFAECLRFVVTHSVEMALLTGLVMIGVKLACSVKTEPNDVYAYIEYFPKLVAGYVMGAALIFVGIVLLVLPGIYLAVAYSMAPLLIVDKKMNPWQALETSRKAVTHCWFRALALFLMTMALLALSILTLGIGLIWVVPMGLILHGIAYRNIFGYQETQGQV